MKIAFITAGGAGMFCGSCMHDNTWARSLQAAGADVLLIPTYTPIRVDEKNLSTREVFLGGINLYLEARSRFWRKIPRGLTRWLDSPWIINLATRFGVSNDAKELGELTLAMLAGEEGPQSREIEELARFLKDDVQPDVIIFSNALLVGALKTIRDQVPAKIYCVLQGDDIFLQDLIEPYKTRALERIQQRVSLFDGILTHSQYYRDFMGRMLKVPPERFHLLPLGIDLTGHSGLPRNTAPDPFTVGYFARICPEKGLHQLVEAFRILHARQPQTRLIAGGYLGKRDQKYFDQLRKSAADLGNAFQYLGSPPTHEEKVAFLQQFDVLSVPTTYHEPKGLYVLEALANGIPVVQPRHGAFPELIAQTTGGILFEPGNARELADQLEHLMLHPELRFQLATEGQRRVRESYSEEFMALKTLELLRASTRQS